VQDRIVNYNSEEVIVKLRDLGLSLTSIISFEEAMSLCLETAVEISKMDSGAIYLFDEVSGSLNLAFHRGVSENLLQFIIKDKILSEIENLLISGKSLFTSSKALIPYIGEDFYREGYKAIGIIPVQYQGKIVAGLVIGSHTLYDFSGYSSTVLETIATRIGSIIVRDRTEKALQASEKRFRLLAENARDIIYRVQLFPVPHFEYVSPSVTHITGYSPKEYYADQWLGFKVIHPDDRFMVEENPISTDFSRPIVQRWIRKDGEMIWAELHNVPIYDDNGSLTAIEGIARDITERQQLDAKLRYISLHDSLTGLYNRAYFTEEMQRLEGGRFDPVGIIVCDVDGLKLVNDNLGHDAGDQLLVAAGNVIRGCFRDSDVVARIGGDEYAVILPQSLTSIVELACRRLHEAIAFYNSDNQHIPLSLSYGWEVREDISKNLNDVFRQADNNMYKDKLDKRVKFHQLFKQRYLSNV
jgi:diguanylate cyclase (GGDEF)-like protein/PAS domain S-box-containing protein